MLQSIPKALNWIKSGKRIDEAKALCPLRSIIQLERVEVIHSTNINMLSSVCK